MKNPIKLFGLLTSMLVMMFAGKIFAQVKLPDLICTMHLQGNICRLGELAIVEVDKYGIPLKGPDGKYRADRPKTVKYLQDKECYNANPVMLFSDAPCVPPKLR